MQNVYTNVYILSWSVHIACRYKIKKGSWQKKETKSRSSQTLMVSMSGSLHPAV